MRPSDAGIAEARDRLIVALDVPSVEAADKAVGDLGDSVSFYKIGYELAFAGGLHLADRLIRAGKQVFLDLKLHDIPNTVSAGIRSVRDIGATFVTVHAYPTTLAAAVEGRGSSSLKILGVTVLTSLEQGDLDRAGYGLPLAELLERRVRDTARLGADGVICAPTDLAAVRRIAGGHLLAVTPGIRPAGTDSGDQKRIATPAIAIAAGADRLVVGRPVLRAEHPAAAADAIVAEIARAIRGRDTA